MREVLEEKQEREQEFQKLRQQLLTHHVEDDARIDWLCAFFTDLRGYEAPCVCEACLQCAGRQAQSQSNLALLLIATFECHVAGSERSLFHCVDTP